jgi:hypothetical protein
VGAAIIAHSIQTGNQGLCEKISFRACETLFVVFAEDPIGHSGPTRQKNVRQKNRVAPHLTVV